MANNTVCRDRQTAFLPRLKPGASCLFLVKLTRVVSGPGGIGLHEQVFPSAFAAFTWIMGDVCPPGDDVITIEHTDAPVLVEKKE